MNFTSKFNQLIKLERLNSLLEQILTPLVSKLKSYIADDWDFLKNLPRNLNPNFTFLTCDIVSLYTKIPQELGLTLS